MQKIKDRILRIFDFYDIEKEEIEFEEIRSPGKDEERDSKIYLNIILPEDQAKHFIGSHGETLDALEILAKLPHLDELKEGERLTIDINGYRKEREEKLRERAVRAALKVIETGREYIFNDLNSYERYLVHSAISEDPELVALETFSEDDTYGRVLIIRLKA